MLNKFLRTFLWFVAPFLVGGVLLFVAPYDSAFGYYQIEQHCRNGHWLYHQFYQSLQNIDIALLGTSRTMCGLNDALMEQELQASDSASELHVANMGFARPGRNLHFVLAKALLSQHKPKVVVLEVRTKEGPYSHMDFPYIADTKDVLLAEPIVNGQFVEDVFTAGKLRFLYWRGRLLGEKLNFDPADIHRRHSFMEEGSIKYSDSSLLRNISLNTPPSGVWEKLEHEFSTHFPKSYVKQIASLCREKGVPLRFLYLPNCNEQPGQVPLELAFYEAIAPVWLPPDSIAHHAPYYGDPDHFNELGAERLTRWVAGQILHWEN